MHWQNDKRCCCGRDDGVFPRRLSDECSLRGMPALIHWGSGVSECRDGMLSIPEPAASEARGEAEWCTPNAWRTIQVKQWRREWTAAWTTTDGRCRIALTTKARMSDSRACRGRHHQTLRICRKAAKHDLTVEVTCVYIYPTINSRALSHFWCVVRQ